MKSTGWFRIKAGAKYAGVSERTLRSWLKTGLRHSRLPTGTILVKREWLDEFLEHYEYDTDGSEVNRIVYQICKGGL